LERRLAAILAADVVGYTALMGADESGTLRRLSDLRRDFLEPLISEHRGRIVKLMGDGILVEFASVVDAVTCAVAWQSLVAEREVRTDDEKRLAFRIGVNLGDVIVEDGDIHGDGVNIAARLEGLADPGGICVSRTVFDHVKGKVDLGFEDLGEQEVKNIAEPVRVYRVKSDTSDAPTHTIPPSGLPLSDKPSIAVLPFTNMSGDPEQEYFSDGITEDIITALAHFRDISVIARNSSFAFKGQSPDVTEIGRKLGAQYLVEGSVRKAGGKVRITAQLVDALTGAHIWAHRYDRDLEDIFAVQDDVTETIVGTLAGRLETVGAERARKKPTTSLTAFDYLLQGRDLLYRFNREDNAKARELLEKAIALDPDYAEPHAFLSKTYLIDWFGGWARDLDACLVHATEIAKRAVALDDSDSLAQAHMGYVLLYRRQYERARQHIERALALNPHHPDLAMVLGLCELWSGNAEVGLAKVKDAMRLDPFGHYGILLGLVHYSLRNYRDAVAAFNTARAKLPTTIARLAASYARLGHDEQARSAAEEFLEVASAGMTTCGVPLPESWLDFLAERHPYQRQDDMDHFLDSLRKAGLE
jgi:adenylate cyclase